MTKPKKQDSVPARAPIPNPGQIKIPIKLLRFPQAYDAPVGFGARQSIESCSTANPSGRHVIDFYPESSVLRITWHPPRQAPASFLVPSGHCYFMLEFGDDDKPKTPND